MAKLPESDVLQMSEEELKDFKRDLLATVYNETHAKLLLLQHGNYLSQAKDNKNIKKLRNSTNTRNANEPMPSAEVLNYIKFDKELEALRNIYKSAYEELTKEVSNLENPYKNTIAAIEDQDKISNKFDVLSNELQENNLTLNHLKDLQIKEQNEINEKITEKSERINALREQLNDIKRINRLEQKLIEKWENSRFTQATIVSENEQRLLMQKILNLQRLLAGEQRLICEIEAFRNNEISELKVKIADWEKKFQNEKTEITTKNAALVEKIADVVKAHEKHREIAEQRKVFVTEYLQQQAEEQRLHEEQCFRIECAIRIQAWWRGVMVRRGLGPYRKKKKKGKKAKNKNNNKII